LVPQVLTRRKKKFPFFAFGAFAFLFFFALERAFI
jgi:hypothetical protein